MRTDIPSVAGDRKPESPGVVSTVCTMSFFKVLSKFVGRFILYGFMFSGGLNPLYPLGIIYIFSDYPRFFGGVVFNQVHHALFGEFILLIAFSSGAMPFLGRRKAVSVLNWLGCAVYALLFGQYVNQYGFNETCAMIVGCIVLTLLSASGLAQLLLRDFSLASVRKMQLHGMRSLR